MRGVGRIIGSRPASRVVHTQSSAAKAARQSQMRLSCVMIFFALSFGALGVRVLEVSVLGGSALPFKKLVSEPHLLINQEEDEESGALAVSQPVVRRDVVDRRGVVLASSIKTASLAANPTLIRHDEKVARALADVLPGISHETLRKKLSNKRSRFVYIKRHLTPKLQEKVNALGVPGLFFEEDTRRVYPYGALTSHVLGFVNVDNQGLSGMERALNRPLMEPWHGDPIALSIDVRVQGILREELAQAVKKFKALGAAALVSDVQTGEVLALVSLPDFDPHNPQKASKAALFNRASLGAYEVGSVFKTFTLAAALEQGVVDMHSGYDATNPIKVAQFTIRDSHPKKRFLTVPEIFAYSSNIGTVKMAMDLGTQGLRRFFGDLGLFAPVQTELPETVKPLVPEKWREINTMTASYGHGISVSGLHVMQAMNALVADGRVRPLTFLKKDDVGEKEEAGPLLVSEKTRQNLRQLLRVVTREGTAKGADVLGYAVGGKTGTAEKVNGSAYNKHAKLVTFAGTFPVYAPRYSVLVMIDEPEGIKSTYGYATGGWVSAPVVGSFVARAAPLLGLAPNEYPQENEVDALWARASGQQNVKRSVRHVAF